MVEDSIDGTRAGPAQMDKPTDYWELTGLVFELPGGARTSAKWAELIRRYGPAVLITEVSALWVRFCGLPDFQFVIDGYNHAGARDNFEMVDSSYTVIPPQAPIVEITLAPDSPRGSRPDPERCRNPGLR
jgi:hypothetical protein